MNTNKPPAANRTDEIDVIAFLRMLWERKIVVIAITGLFGLASVYYALTATDIYRAQVVVTRVSDANMSAAASIASQLGGLANLAGVSMGGGGSNREAQAILESRHLVEEFIRQHDLLSEISPEGGEPLSLWQAVQKFRGASLTIRDNNVEGTLMIAVSWTDPETAALWANQYVALANELIRTRALEGAARNIEYLNEQIGNTSVVEIQNVIYHLIESETKTLMLANARDEYAFTVIDPAVAPEFRSSPKRKLIVVSGGAVGFVLSVLIILLWNFVGRFKQREQHDV